MTFISPAVDHVARKIARVPGVEASFIGKDGAVDAVLETAFDRPLRQHVIQLGMRAMVPVRVFYRMPDGNIVGEERKGEKIEAIEDFYTNIHVAGFAGSDPSAPPEAIAGDAYGDKVGKEKDDRDDYGQLKLVRIRSASRGRQVLGWRYGKSTVRVGDKVKFKEPCVLQWTMGRTVKVGAGMSGAVSQVSSKSPMAYLSIGGHDGIELPVHAVGHVYDVMIDPALESKNPGKARDVMPKDVLHPLNIARKTMTVGFGRPHAEPWVTAKNGPNFKSQDTGPDWTLPSSKESEEDMVVPPSAKEKAPSKKKGDDRSTHVAPDEPSLRVSIDGHTEKKTVLLGRK
jgi:hypothetical protein